MLAAAAANFAHRRASELGAAHHQRVLPQTARLQILDHRRERLVGILGVDLVREDVAVRVPRIALGVVDLRHAHALFGQPHGHQASARHRPGPYRSSVGLRTPCGCRILPALRSACDRRFPSIGSRLPPGRPCRAAVRQIFEFFQQIQFAALFGQRELRVVHVADELLRIELTSRSRPSWASSPCRPCPSPIVSGVVAALSVARWPVCTLFEI